MPTPTKGPRLGGGPAHERLMLANLASALFEHKRITTTVTKANAEIAKELSYSERTIKNILQNLNPESVDGVRLIGTARHKASILSFVMEGVHPHDIGTILDDEGVARQWRESVKAVARFEWRTGALVGLAFVVLAVLMLFYGIVPTAAIVALPLLVVLCVVLDKRNVVFVVVVPGTLAVRTARFYVHDNRHS